jgi:hypothetical protein
VENIDAGLGGLGSFGHNRIVNSGLARVYRVQQ